MSSISALSKLSFFTVGHYQYENSNVCDFSNCPRPHTCMGLILEGEGTFYFGGEEVTVYPGDIIYVPITSKYISKWKGNPNISYISMHFVFEGRGIYRRDRIYKIQKITLPDFPKLKSDFEFAFANYNSSDSDKLKVLNIFYGVMSLVCEKLKYTEIKSYDPRIEKAIEYIEQNSENDISVPYLADLCSMSISHFYSYFKSATGVTPIEYKLRFTINRAIQLLTINSKKSIEEISSELGFYSSTYFRRVFKKFTKKTPSEYRKTTIEL